MTCSRRDLHRFCGRAQPCRNQSDVFDSVHNTTSCTHTFSRSPVSSSLRENEVIQSSGIDLRVDGITQEEVYNDKQYMEEVKKASRKAPG